ncbi:MAG: RluA family pseudouridine synthase [Clostridiales bacterium]|nr:RluA family pseudouridine synthase [Clostridiales bacterium]
MSDIIKKVIIENLNENEKVRIDKFLSSNLNLSRNLIKDSIKNCNVKVNGKKINPSYVLKNGDLVDIEIIEEKKEEITLEDINNLNKQIVYEDEEILVINKNKGLIVQSSIGNEKTLSDILYEKYLKEGITLPGEDGRRGIVHRLDKDTSGLMVIAKTENAYIFLIEEFKERRTKKKYKTIVKGIIKEDENEIDMPIGRDEVNRHKMKVRRDGKNARTVFKVIERFGNYTYLDVRIYTGRTHQIRVHLSKIGYPILGDEIYSKGKNKFDIKGQVLQSYFLEFIHPQTKEKMSFEIEESNEIKKILKELRK